MVQQIPRVIVTMVLGIGLMAAGSRTFAQQRKAKRPAVVSADGRIKLDRYGDPLPAGAALRLGTTRLRHGGHGGSQSVLFSGDGKLLLSSKGVGDVRCWDPVTGKLVRTVKIAHKHNWDWEAIALSPDSKTLASAAPVDGVRLWDFATGKELHQLRSGRVRSLVFTPDSQKLICGGGDYNSAVRVFHVQTGKEQLRIVGHHREVSWVACSPDGKRVVSASYLDRKVICTNIETGETPYTLVLPDEIWTPAIALAGDGQTLALGGYSGGDDKPLPWLALYDANSGKEIRKLEGHKRVVYGLGFSPDGKTLASVSRDDTLRIWDVATGRELRKVATPHEALGPNLVFAPDGRTLATLGWDCAIALWDVRTGTRRHAHDCHEGAVKALAFSPDGKVLASGANDHTVRLWNLATGETPHVLRHPRVFQIAFLPDGKTVLSFGMDWCFRFWDADKGNEIRKLQVDGPYQGVRMSLTDDGKTLFAFTMSSAGQVEHYGTKAWDVPTNKQTLQRESEVRSSSASPDGKLIATRHGRSCVLQEATTGKPLTAIEAPPEYYFEDPYVFSPDSKLLAVRSYRPRQEGGLRFPGNLGVRSYDVATGKERHHLPSTTSYGPVVFSPDGMIIAIGGNVGEGSIELFDVATGKEHRRISGCGSRSRSLAFSPDGKRLAAGLDDSSVLIWDVKR